MKKIAFFLDKLLGQIFWGGGVCVCVHMSISHALTSPPSSHPSLSPSPSYPPLIASGHEKFYRCDLADLVWLDFCLCVCICVHASVCMLADLETCHCVKRGCWHPADSSSSPPLSNTLSLTHTYIHTTMQTHRQLRNSSTVVKIGHRSELL